MLFPVSLAGGLRGELNSYPLVGHGPVPCPALGWANTKIVEFNWIFCNFKHFFGDFTLASLAFSRFLLNFAAQFCNNLNKSVMYKNK